MLTRMLTRNRIFIAALALLLCAQAVQAQTTAFTYQGKLNDAGNPANGTYDIQFKVFDALAGGTQQGATFTNATVMVTGGIFTVELDFGATVFDGTARYLEIGIRPAGNANPYTVLAPRQSIASTPYAQRSAAAGAADGLSAACVNCVTGAQVQSIDGAQITGTVAGSQISGTIPPASVPTGSTNYIQNSVAAARAGRPLGAQEGGFDITGNGIIGGNLVVNGGVGIGFTTPTANQLYVLNSTPGFAAIYGESASGRAVWGKSVTSKGVFGESTSLEGVQGVSDSGAGVSGVSTSGVGVYGQSAAANLLTSPGVYGRATGTGGTGVYALSTGSGGIGVYGESVTGRGVWGKSVGSRGVYGESVNNVGVWGFSSNSTGVIGISTNGYGVDGNSASPTGFGGHFSNTGGGKALKVEGTGSIGVLEITGGLDLAEHFEIAEGGKPGLVVAIDPHNPGRFSIAHGVYNRRVAGIISGANNLAAGMILSGVKQSKESMPIALSGRVWVYCDATKHAIRPGDLLTTSNTAGHAMRVINHTRAQGAVIGKAMTGLKSGKGLVLVLVTLQ